MTMELKINPSQEAGVSVRKVLHHVLLKEKVLSHKRSPY